MLHDWNHTGEKHFKCTQCNKAFENTGFFGHNTGLTLQKSHLSALSVVQVLMLHDWNHTGEKQFKCTQCDKAFENTAVLCYNTGLTGEKPFKCTQNGEAFEIRAYFEGHLKILTFLPDQKTSMLSLVTNYSNSQITTDSFDTTLLKPPFASTL